MPKKPKAETTLTAGEMYDKILKQTKDAKVLAPDAKALLRAQCEQTVFMVTELRSMNNLLRQVVSFNTFLKKLIDEEYNSSGQN